MARPKLARPVFRVVAIPGREILYVAWTEDGKRKVQSTGTRNPEQAERARARIEAEYLSPSEDDTVGELIDKWLKAREHKPSIVKLRQAGKVAKAEFGGLLPSQISNAVVADYIQRAAHKPTTARRALEILTFATGVKTERPAKRQPRDRYLSHAEAQTLLLHCTQEHLRMFVRLALATGARHRAILGLTWDRVDLEKGIVDYRDPARVVTKKRRGVCPIGPKLAAELKAWRRHTRNHVIEWHRWPLKDIGHAFRTAAREAKMPWATPHVLKHTAISWLAEKGYTVDQISDFTLTSRDVVGRIYRKVNPESLRDMAEALDDFATPVAKTPPNSPKPREKGRITPKVV